MIDLNKNNKNDFNEVKKFWLKSKTVIINLLTMIFSTLCFFLEEIKLIIDNHIDFIKSSNVDDKYIFACLALLSIANIYLRFKTKTKICFKKNEDEDKVNEVIENKK